MGFKFDFSIFTSSPQPDPLPVGHLLLDSKHLNIRYDYESSSVQNINYVIWLVIVYIMHIAIAT